MATCSDIEIKPDHVIIWLDKSMSVPENNRSSKKDLANNASLACLPSDERSLDIDNFIHSSDQNMNNEKFDDLIKSPLRMFTDKTECITCINDNIDAGKQPFLITSGQMGALIVPDVYTKISGFIYVFCAQMHLHDWAYDYIPHIEMYDNETDVFVRLLRDIGRYYMKKSQENSSSRTSSIKYLEWARRLILRANKLDKEDGEMLFKEINNQLALLESSQSDVINSDDQIGKDADEG